ncbi:MAG: hypothetical protein IPM55_09380 [Acidobacteria bacterium]|nr:hypothetical protein [Acidobacteriota bacterium]
MAPQISGRSETARASKMSISRRNTWSIFLEASCWISAAFLIVWSWQDARFRDAAGVLSGSVCLPISIGVACALLSSAFFREWRQSGAWLALAIVGQGAALQMIDAGRMIGYQHLRPFSSLFNSSPVIMAIFALQSILVIGGVLKWRRQILQSLLTLFKPWQLAVIGLAFVLTSATVSRVVSDYLIELPSAALVQSINLFNILLAIRTLPESSLAILKIKIDKLFGAPGEEGPAATLRIDRFALIAAIWVTALAGLLSYFSYERHPHIADEVVYLLHARYFAAGMLTMPAPPVQEAFHIDLMNYEPSRWFSPVPPGWPAMLAAGVLLGIPWLINPLLGGLHVLLAYLLIGELYDRRTARIVVFLLCLSPWHVFMAMNFMTHTFAGVCTLGAAVAIVAARRSGRAVWALPGGIAAAFVGAIRPLEGLIVAGLLGLWAIGIGGKRLKASSIAAFVLGGLLIAGLLLPYNKYLTGSTTKFPIMDYTDKYYGPNSNAMGFGADRGLGWALDPYPGHGPVDALINANLNIFSINIELLGWSAGSILLMAVLIFSGSFRKNDYLMMALIAATFIAHFFYWYSGGPDFGARYWYLMLVPCVVLSVRGLQVIEEKGALFFNTQRPILLVMAFSLMALINYFPWRAIDKYHHYLEMRPDIRTLAKEYNFGRSLVLIRGSQFPEYASAAVYNPLDLDAAAPIFAWDKNPEVRARTLESYPDRPVWIIDGPSITGGGFRISSGPVSAGSLTGRSD